MASTEPGSAIDSPVVLSRAVLIVNAHAGAGEDRLELALAALRGVGLKPVFSCSVTTCEEARKAAQEAVSGGARLVLVGGGDGTLNGAAQALAGTDVALGVLPLGTANDFARNLGLPRDLDEACAALANGVASHVDVGEANGRVFLNAVSFGLTSRLTRALTPELKKRARALAYPVAAAGEALAMSPFTLRLTVDGETQTLSALQVVVGNGRYHGGGRLIAPESSVTSHTLHAYVIKAPEAQGSPLEQLRLAGRLARVGALLLRGRHLEHPEVLHVRAPRLRLETDEAVELDVDGELDGHTPVDLQVRPAALKVLTPRPLR